MRKAVADWFVLIDDMLTEANSHSIMADRLASGWLSSEQFIELNKVTTPFLDAMGFSPKPEHSEENLHALQGFVERQEMDLLQVDKAQFNLINNTNPPHRLVELGLSNRCFTAATIEESVQIIETTLRMSS
jgi:hypothetical protein